jgi:hypothetical protein
MFVHCPKSCQTAIQKLTVIQISLSIIAGVSRSQSLKKSKLHVDSGLLEEIFSGIGACLVGGNL